MTPKRTNTSKHPKAKKIIRTTLKYTAAAIFLAGLASAVGVTIYVDKTLNDVPVITEAMLKSDGTSNMYDANGNIIWSDTKVRRDYVKYKDIPQTYIDLLLATEDATYFKDGGFSKKAQVRAVVSQINEKVFHKGVGSGGSSIEQQLVKNTVFSTFAKDRTISRKVKELWLAEQLSKNFSKEQTLEYYINKINMGENSYGADTIAMTYYGKHLKEMSEKNADNISKLAAIAGLGQAPSAYNLYDNPKDVTKRRNIVLKAAYDNGKISKKLYKAAQKVDVTKDLQPRYWRNDEVQAKVAKYNAYVSSTLEQVKELGYDMEKTPLQIKTHLQPEKYDWLIAEIAKPQYYQDEKQQVAATVVDVKTGQVIAQAGGRTADQANSLNRAIQRTRSSGSTIKPFIDYSPMIEYFGMATNSTWSSAPYQYPGTSILAQNYGGYTYGNVTAQYSLRMSLNTTVLRMLDGTVGSQYAKSMLQNYGMDVKETYGGSDALGIDVSTQDLALAFATVAREGQYQKPSYIDTLTFSDGSTRKIETQRKQTVKASTAYTLISMLKGVTDRGMSGEKAAMPEMKGLITKTGTVGYDMSDGVWRPDLASSDSWMAGATKSIAVAVWTGYDSPNEPGHWLTPETSTRYDLYQSIMRHYNKGRDTSDWSKPDTVTSLGGGHYKPNDTSNVSVYNPLVGEPADDTWSTFNSKDTKQIVGKQKKEDSGVPKDYKAEEWVDELKSDDKDVYDKWSRGIEAYPELPSDVYQSSN